MTSASGRWQGTERFRVRDLLGRGGMGEVYLCEDRDLQREVAVKVLGSSEGEGGSERARLRREAQALARVHHAHLISLLDTLVVGQDLCLVLEYLPGETLDRRLERGETFSVAEVTRLGLELGGALQALHAAGVFHRDLTPRNVMLAPEGRAVLMDLGLAVLRDATTLTAENVLLGTPRYLPPEALQATEWSAASDQYQLGAVLFEALVGAPLVPGESMDEVVHGIMSGTRGDYSRVRPPPPTWLRRFLDRATSQKASRRFPDMEAALSVLASGEAPAGTGGEETQELDTSTRTGELPPPSPASRPPVSSRRPRDPGTPPGKARRSPSRRRSSRKRPESRSGSRSRSQSRNPGVLRSPSFLLGTLFGLLVSVASLVTWWWVRPSPSRPLPRSPVPQESLQQRLERALRPFRGSSTPDLETARRRLRPDLDRLGEFLVGDIDPALRRSLWTRLQAAQLSLRQDQELGSQTEPLEISPGGIGWRSDQPPPFSRVQALEVADREGGDPETWNHPEGGRLKLEGGPDLTVMGRDQAALRLWHHWPAGLAGDRDRVALTFDISRMTRDLLLRLEWESPREVSPPVELWVLEPPSELGEAWFFKGDMTVVLPRSMLPTGPARVRVSLAPVLRPSLQIAVFRRLLVSWEPGNGEGASRP